MNLTVVVLAAGAGTRMHSAIPKVLHPIGGKPMLGHVLDAAFALQPTQMVVVYGHGGELVRQSMSDRRVVWVEQMERLGTGHAVAQAMPHIPDENVVVVLYGDVPLIDPNTLRQLVAGAQRGELAVLTTHLNQPAGYGRMVRDAQGKLMRIVEEKDASVDQKRINEVNTGFLAAPGKLLCAWLSRIDSRNAQHEFYLTDVIGLAYDAGCAISTLQPGSEDEVLGVNNRVQLADLERRYQRRQAERLMLAGVTLLDPTRLDIRGQVEAGTDVVIDANVILEGQVKIGNRVRIGANVILRNSRIADDVEIFPNSIIEESTVGAQSRIGPFARLRPETILADHVHVGNFVEIKKSDIGARTKMNHLSYIGDSTIGVDVNVGAGTITCNYDGANKHRTVIGDRVFVGSDTQLVAPVTVHNDATIGAGTTVTKDVPEGVLCISRVTQQVRTGWRRPKKK